MQAVNWNHPEDAYTKTFWDQNVRQFWVDEEIPLADDKPIWMGLSPDERGVYQKVLAGLTLLDTLQGGVGMPALALREEGLQRKAVLSFMGAMEQMHAKSYSSIFSTLATLPQIEALFNWVQQDPLLQGKRALIEARYRQTQEARDWYLALSASVLLESYLFYSGFFYPLYLAGAGKMVNAGEIINLILRDESVHGAYVGMMAQEVYQGLSADERRWADGELLRTLEELEALEARYTRTLYYPIGLEEEVLVFSRYNADKALMNLGQEPHFGVGEGRVNPVVIAGMSTQTKNHDFFSTKGNGYVKALRVEPLRDEDFYF
ncbi:MAG: class 1b ribonucleoside-diphosphate reductase subunit beta [Meiothermus sp.]